MSAFNGSGTFVISGVGLPFVTGTTISSTVANQLNTDLATGLSECITKDGQTTPTANIKLGGYKLTGVGAATAAGDALSFGGANGAGGLVGTATNDNATAGYLGEFISASATGVSVSAVVANITSVSLTAGDWDVCGVIGYTSTGGAAATSFSAGITTTSATLPAFSTGGLIETSAAFSANLGNNLPFSPVRFSLAGTTTIYMVGAATFSGGTITGSGYLRARRVR